MGPWCFGYYDLNHIYTFLPCCGLVYGALMAAVGQGTTGGSVFLMMGFGLGSMPSLFVLGLVGSRIGSRV
jgi:sulfite exporter TauE/SafE